MKSTTLEKRRREQSEFRPGLLTADRVLTLNLISQTRREYRQPLYVAYIDLNAAFDSIDRRALSKLFQVIEIPTKLVRLFQALHQDTESCIKYDGSLTEWFPVETGVCQGCVLSPDAFNVAMDKVLNQTTGRAMVGTSLGETKYTDLNFADDVVLFSDLWGVLESALLIFSEEVAELGLQINWNKTKIQSLSDFLPKPPDLFINDTRVESVDSFVYLGVLINGSCTSADKIS